MDAITSDAVRSDGLPLIRSTIPPIGATVSPGTSIQGSNPVSTMFEHILASLPRFETRMDDFDRRLVPPRSTPEQSFGLPSHWFTDSLPRSTPLSIPTQSVLTSIPASTSSHRWEQPGSSMGATGGIPTFGTFLPPFSTPSQGDGLGVRWQAGSGQGNSWEPPGGHQGMAVSMARQPTSWDNPAWNNNGSHRAWEQPRDVKMKPPRFTGSDAVNWIARIQYYFDHLMMPEAYRLHYVVMLFCASSG